MKKTILMSCICTLALSYSINVQAKIYKWTDSNGVIHYTATPPVQKTKSEAKDIEEKILFAAGKHRPKVAETKKSTNNGEEENNNDEESQRQTSAPKLAPPSKKLVSYCKSQRTNLATLKKNFRNTWKDASGKTKRLDQSERKAKVKNIMQSISKECEGV